MTTCKGISGLGEPCKARPLTESDYCFFHDPASQHDRQEAQRKGGSKSSRLHVLSSPPSDFDLSNPHEIAKLLTYTANRVLRGELDPKTAYALGYLGDCALRARNAGAIAERLDRLEELQRAEYHMPADDRENFDTWFESGRQVLYQKEGNACTKTS